MINGNPYEQTVETPTDLNDLEKPLSSDKALPYTKALPSKVSIEIDNEILQGAQISIEYTITVMNRSEKDYKYKENHDYYYYGTNGTEEASTVVRKIVDYMDDNLIYEDKVNESLGWQKVTADDLINWKGDNEENNGQGKQLIAKSGDKIGGKSYNVYDGIKKGYTIGITEVFYKNGDGIKPGEIASTKIYGSKLLSTSESGFSADNHAEIIETQGIRTLEDSIPGNYNPSDSGGSPHELDDDKTSLTITPPTGLTDNRVFIISMTAVILVAFAGGIYLIKKKVLG